MNHVLTFLLLLGYFALHSLLAADSVKNWFAGKLGSRFRFYRLLYNGVATALLAVLLWQTSRDTQTYFFEKSLFTNLAGLVLAVSGAWIALIAFLQYDLGEFTGFRQLKQQNTAPNHSVLNTSGLNGLVRHPLYLGTLLLLAGWFLLYPKTASLLFLASVVVYLPFGIYFEEKKLRRQFGQAYADYQKRVKCLIPFLV